MESVMCSCKHCTACLGEFINVSKGADSSYAFPDVVKVRLQLASAEASPSGDLYLSCHDCGKVVGFRIINPPVGHGSHRGQMLLKRTSVLLTTLDGVDIPTTETTHREFIRCEVAVEIQLSTNDSSSSESRNQSLSHLQTQLPSESQKEEPKKLNKSGSEKVPFNGATLLVDDKIKDDMANLRERLTNQHARIVGVDDDADMLRGKVNEIDKLLQSQPDYTHLKQKLSVSKQTIISDRLSTSKEVLDLKLELSKLKEELAKERSQKPSSEPTFPAREIDILTTNVIKIGAKASQVDPLQMKLELLEERVRRLEKARAPDSRDVSDVEAQHNRMAPTSEAPLPVESKSAEPHVDEVTPATGVPTVNIPGLTGQRLPELPKVTRKRKHSPQPGDAANSEVPSGTLSKKRRA
ncbi:hypothetical protein F4818DRAFT_88453 [Hypoxylon cercidicola]|nr:hypothetical protein F4818DRAFT_88453 [Hypoxylon cercidicola]